MTSSEKQYCYILSLEPDSKFPAGLAIPPPGSMPFSANPVQILHRKYPTLSSLSQRHLPATHMLFSGKVSDKECLMVGTI